MKMSKSNPDRAKVSLKSRVTKLLTENDKVVGLEFVKGGQTFQEMGPVILCTGGYGADLGQDSLLTKYRSDIKHFPTSNGPHCTGDGIKMSQKIGADVVDMEWVQVHPTGIVDPKNPKN
jgi:succinate dehydrogenase/fumarate reductase flavoprotein subunit